MRVHRLKLKKNYFEDVKSKKKTFELRYNDRGYSVGDMLWLTEIDEKQALTGRIIVTHVGYILDKFDGLRENYVILGFEQTQMYYFSNTNFLLAEVLDFYVELKNNLRQENPV